MLAFLTVLLKVQMHLLARNVDITSQSDNLNASERDNNWEDENNVFRALVEGTYKHLFSTGLHKLTAIIRQQLTDEMLYWAVREKLSVPYSDISQLMNKMRDSIESDMPNLIKEVIIRKY
jgi:bisphosphoglycerate-independent phosphoglycerate mutase (AlkP superfamily)